MDWYFFTLITAFVLLGVSAFVSVFRWDWKRMLIMYLRIAFSLLIPLILYTSYKSVFL